MILIGTGRVAAPPTHSADRADRAGVRLMPELPEVERARAAIEDAALGRRIVEVDDTDTWVCRPHAPGEIVAALRGRKLTAAHRQGKSMWCETSGLGRSRTPGPTLGIHLGMSGRMVITQPGGQPTEGGDRLAGPYANALDDPRRNPVWDRFTLTFADGGSLALFDKRRLGPGPDRSRSESPRSGRPAGRPARVHPTAEPQHGTGQGPAARPVGDRRSRQPAGRRDPVAGQAVAAPPRRRADPDRDQPALPQPAEVHRGGHRARRGAHRRDHRVPRRPDGTARAAAPR